MTTPHNVPQRLALYARVSSTDQDCSVQLSELRQWIERMGWPKAQEYVDHGFSGAKASRPDFDRLMEKARARLYDCVLVWRIDRFGRSVLHLCNSLAQLQQAGVRFVAASQGLDTDSSNPASRLLLMILAAIAEFERELILERSKAGRAKKLANNQPDSWNLVRGFVVEDGYPNIGPDMEIARQLFRLRDEGLSVYQIAGRFAAAGIKPLRGRFYRSSTLSQMLENHQFIGQYDRCGRRFEIRDKRGQLLCPIDPEVFHRVHANKEDLDQATVGRPPTRHLLAQFLWCEMPCQGRWTTNDATYRGKLYRYYRCTHAAHRDNPNEAFSCRRCRIRAERLEDPVFDAIWDYASDAQRVRSGAEALARDEKKKRAGTRDPRAELEKARKQEARLQQMTEQGIYTVQEGADKIRALRGKISKLEGEARAFSKVVDIAPLDVVQNACRAIARMSVMRR